MTGETHDLNHDFIFSAHTINCVCHSIRSMFRVLGIYNFEKDPNLVQLVLSPPTIIQTYAFHTFIPPKQPCSSSLVTYSQVQRQYTQVHTYSKRKDQRPFIVTFLLPGQITILQTYLSFQTKLVRLDFIDFR